MAEQRTDPGVPLPDPDTVQQTFEKYLAKYRERPNYYFGWAVAICLGVIAVLVVLNLDTSKETAAFGPLWQRCENVRDKLRINTSAAAELVELEEYLKEIRGKPEEARGHFEKAIAMTDGRDLSAKVEFARGYAKLLYDRELHDRLLNEVLASDPYADRLTLSNVIAQRDAEVLLAEAEDYF